MPKMFGGATEDVYACHGRMFCCAVHYTPSSLRELHLFGVVKDGICSVRSVIALSERFKEQYSLFKHEIGAYSV